jgi:ABC-type multidrug transport system ATPase subunit
MFLVFRFALEQPSYMYCSGFVAWSYVIAGISLIFFSYILSFIFQDPETSGSVVMLVPFLIAVLITVIVVLLKGKGEQEMAWIWAWIPWGNLFLSLSTAGTLAIPSLDVPFSQFWSTPTTQPLLIGQVLSLILYVLGLWLIEFLRKVIGEFAARKHFQKHLPSIPAADITEEAITVGEEAQDMSKPFAIRIRNVSRVFLDDRGKPIAAVNNVSLGVKHGALFGFLGANGAGKTTLMKMITEEIPPSSGSISVEGRVAICPQFNSHLTNEMTVTEHFKFFTYIFGLDGEMAARECDRFVEELALGDHLDKELAELSGGNARKLAIAVAMLSPAKVVLLDEPTSSLDPLARHAAQRLMSSFRGEKTMMLCTHLLSEAEELCEALSIMLKGSVYVVGSPSYLSGKFGTEWRLDVLFSGETDGRFGAFLCHEIPSTKLIIHRPANEIYSIPSAAIPMKELFRFMDGVIKRPEFAVKFFTASSATLEKVFMELVLRSEERDQAADGENETKPNVLTA